MLIYTGLEENYNLKDVLFSILQLLKFWKWRKGEQGDQVKKWFKDYFGVKNVLTFDSARSALYCLLKSYNLQKGDEVIVQAFTCVATVNPILWNGLKPVFVDIDKDTLNMDAEDLKRKINHKTRVIIVQHTFGYPVEVEKIKNLALTKGIQVVEDCAHTIGGGYKNKKLGTFGNAAIFSFGSDKAVSGVSGGLLVTDNEHVLARIINMELNDVPRKLIFKRLLHPSLEWFIRTFYNFFFVGKVIHYISLKLKLISKSNTVGEKKRGERPKYIPAKLPNALAALTFRQLNQIDELNKHRSKLTSRYNEKLSGLNKVEQIKYKNKDKKIFLLRYPLLEKNKSQRDKIIEKAKKGNIILGDWYNKVIGPKEVDLEAVGYKKGECLVAEEISDRIFNLPLHRGIKEADIQKMLNVINM